MKLFFAVLLLAANAGAQEMRVWVADGLTSVKSGEPSSGAGKAELSAARNEYADFQVVVRAPAGRGLTGVNVSASIPGMGVKLYRAQYVPVRVRSPADRAGDPGYTSFFSPNEPREWADALIPSDVPGGLYQSFPFSVPASSNQPVYIDVYVPKGTAPGVCRGSVTIVADGQAPVVVPVSLTVWGFTLPDHPALATDFLSYDRWLWNAAGEVGADRATLEKNIWAALADHRLGGEGVLDHWTGGRADKDFVSSWLSREKILPVSDQMEAGELADFETYLSTLGRRGDVFVRFSDEPHTSKAYDEINRRTPFWRSAGIPTQVTVGWHTSWTAFDADIWVVHHARLRGASDRAAVDEKLKKGEAVWSYYCCEAPSALPSWMLDSDLINYRITPWLDYTSGFKGMLYWATAYWVDGATATWTNAKNGNGDGVLFYPGSAVGAPNAAIPSARLKAIRDGVQDYDYLFLLESLGAPADAKHLAATIAGDWEHWSRDPRRLQTVRAQLAAKILALSPH